MLRLRQLPGGAAELFLQRCRFQRFHRQSVGQIDNFVALLPRVLALEPRHLTLNLRNNVAKLLRTKSGGGGGVYLGHVGFAHRVQSGQRCLRFLRQRLLLFLAERFQFVRVRFPHLLDRSAVRACARKLTHI